MGVEVDKEKCCYCGACVGACPVMALELDETKILADNSKCIDCGACVWMCPVGCITDTRVKPGTKDQIEVLKPIQIAIKQ